MPPAIAGVIAAAAQAAVVVIGGTSLAAAMTTIVTTFAVTTLLGAVAQTVFAQDKTLPKQEPSARLAMVRSAIEPRRLIFGRARVSGALVYAQAKDGYFYMVVALAGHQVSAIGDVWLNGTRVGALNGSGDCTSGKFAGHLRVRKYLGTSDQAAEADLVAAFPNEWTADHRLRGVAYLYLRLKRNDDIYTTGVPTPSAEVLGLPCFDPRTNTTVATDNPALLLREYLRHPLGKRIPDAELDDASFIAAANVCEELITLGVTTIAPLIASAATDTFTADIPWPYLETGARIQLSGSPVPAPLVDAGFYYVIRTGRLTYKLAATYEDALRGNAINLTTAGALISFQSPQQRRYTANGSVTLDRTPRDIVQQLCAAMGDPDGLIPTQGVYRVYPGAYVVPDKVLDESLLRGAVSIQPRAPRKEAFNGVRGTFVDPNTEWQPRDYRPVQQALYVAEDNDEEIWTEYDQPLCTNEARAQRMARLLLERHRQGIVVEWPGMIGCFDVQVGDRVQVNLEAAGWVGKVFRCVRWELSDDFGVNLTLVEDAAAIYSWNYWEAVTTDLAPDTTLPSPGDVAAPTALTLASGTDQLLLGTDGTVLSRIRVTWALADSAGNVTAIDVAWKQSSAADWSMVSLPPDATGTYIDSVQDGASYDVRVRARSSLGATSGWVQAAPHVVVGKTAPPANVTGFTHALSERGPRFTWNDVADVDRLEFEVRRGLNWDVAAVQWRGNALVYQAPPQVAGTVSWWIKAVDTSGNVSVVATQRSVTVNAPPAPSLSGAVIESDVVLSWPAVTADQGVAGYRVRHGATWGGGVQVAEVTATTLKRAVDWVGDRIWWVAAVDAAGNEGAPASVTVSVQAPAAPSVGAAIEGGDVRLSWPAPSATLPLELYDVRYGASWAGGTSVGTIKGSTLVLPVTWSGSRTFWVAAVDVAGNAGPAGAVSVNVVAPAAPALSGQVVDNFALLTWTEPAATLPIARYELRRGATWAGGTSLGITTARFSVWFEQAAATHTYWVAAVDTAGNVGAASAVTLQIKAPPDYLLYTDQNSTFAGTRTSVLLEGGALIGPVNITETWSQHFVNNGYTTVQDQINAGLPLYLQPAPNSGTYEETIDYGASIALAQVIVSVTRATISGTPTFSTDISYKLNIGDAWTDVIGVTNYLIATPFRYVKVRLNFGASGGDDLLQVSALNVKIAVKKKKDSGVVVANAGDSGGTTVTFAEAFADVESIQCTPLLGGASAASAAWVGPTAPFVVSGGGGGGERIAVYDFVDAPNPTTFKVLLFDRNGVRQTGEVRWEARGV